MSKNIPDPNWYPQSILGWKRARLKAVVDGIDAGVWGDDPYDDEGSLVLRSNEIDEAGNWRIDTPAIRLLTHAERNKATLRKGDLLIVKSSGSTRHIGKSAIVSDEVEKLDCCFSNFICRLRVSATATCSRLLWYYLNNSPRRDQLFYNGTTTTGLINLSATSIGAGVITVPRLPEQERIAAYLDASCAATDAAVAAKRPAQTEELYRGIGLGAEFHERTGVVIPKLHLVRKLTRQMAKRPRIGDIFEIPLTSGFAYGHYILKYTEPPSWGEFVRILRGVRTERVTDWEALSREDDQFLTFYPLGRAVREGVVTIVGHVDVPERLRTFPAFKTYGKLEQVPGGCVLSWLIGSGAKIVAVKHEDLTEAQRQQPLKRIIGHESLIQRIESGWTHDSNRCI